MTTIENRIPVEQSEYEAESASVIDCYDEIESYPDPSDFDLNCSDADLTEWFEATMVSEAMARLQSLGLEDQHERLRRVIGPLQNDQPTARIVSAVLSHRDPRAVALSVRRAASGHLDQLIEQAAKRG